MYPIIGGMIKNLCSDNYSRIRKIVASPGIEPGSGASETHILSIVLRGHSF